MCASPPPSKKEYRNDMKARKATLGLALFSMVFATLAVACDFGKDSDADVNSHSDRSGTLELKLTDAPLENVESVYVTFSEVAVHYCGGEGDEDDKDEDDKDKEDKDKEDKDDKGMKSGDDTGGDDKGMKSGDGKRPDSDSTGEGTGEPTSARNADETTAADEKDKKDDKTGESDAKEGEVCKNGSWKRIKLVESAKFDLLTLQNGKTADLGVSELPAGHYGQIRLKLESASLVVNGEEQSLKVPSGAQSGLKINGGFEVVADKTLSLTIDFDAGKSLKETKGQGWILKPVIKLLK